MEQRADVVLQNAPHNDIDAMVTNEVGTFDWMMVHNDCTGNRILVWDTSGKIHDAGHISSVIGRYLSRHYYGGTVESN